jgi:conjugal transfer pilus assembly protein TraD
VTIADRALEQHTLILGTTRCGKSTLAELLSVQAIIRGEPVIVINPKEPGRWLDWSYAAAAASGRGDKFHFFSLAYPESSARYNPLQNFTDCNELADRVVIPLPESRDAAPYKAFCHKVMHTVAESLVICGMAPTFDRLLRYSIENMGELVKMVLCRLFPYVFRASALGTQEGLKSAIREYQTKSAAGDLQGHRALDRLVTLFGHPIDNYQRMTNSLIPYLTTLSTGPMGKIMCVDRGDFSWLDVVENREIVYMDLAGLKGLMSSEAVGRMIVSDLLGFVGARYAYYESRPTIHLFVDEIANVMTKEFIDVLNKAAGTGLRVTMIGQSIDDLEAALSGASQARRVLDNVSVKIQMRAADEMGAQRFSELSGKAAMEREEVSMTVRPAFFSSGRSYIADYDQSQSRSRRLVEQYLVPPAAVAGLSVGEGFVKMGRDLRFFRVRPLERPPLDFLRDVKGVGRL